MAPRKTGDESLGESHNREPVGRDNVMQVALQMFLQNGFAGTSMKSVARELGISAPALYWYFPSKEELYVQVIERTMEDFVAHVSASAVSPEPVERLGQMVRAHVTWQLQQADVARAFDLTMSIKALTQDIPPDRLESIRKMELRYVEEFRAVLREGVRLGVMLVDDVKSTAFAVITLCEYVHTWFRAGGEMSVPGVADRYASLAYRMVGASPTIS